MNKIITILSILSIVSVQYGFAQGNEKLNVAVLTFNVSGGIPEIYALAMTDRLRHELFSTGAFKVMERGEMDEILNEIGFQQTGCTSTECVIEAGKILGISHMIAGTVSKFDRLHTITLRLISVATSQIVKSVVVDHMGTLDELITIKMQESALKLAGLYTPGSSPSAAAASEGAVNIKSTPSGAKIFIDRVDTKLKTPANISIPSGVHNIKLIKGDKTGAERVFVVSGRTIPVNIALQTGYGSLSVKSNPAGASVYLNKKLCGKTPFVQDSIKAGNYNLEITRGGYTGYRKDIKISLNQKAERTITLLTIASLKVTSNPSGAEVELNGKFTGRTPLELDSLKTGDYQLKISKSGYTAHTEKVKLVVNESLRKSIVLKKYGSLSVYSKPPESAVFLNGKNLGKTPVKLDTLTVGRYNLKISKAGYVDFSENIQVKLNQTFRKVVNLKQLAKMTITSNPAGASLIFDGEYTGATPYKKIKMIPGSYNLEMSIKRYKKLKAAIDIAEGSDKTYNFDLIPKKRSTAMWMSAIIPGAGQIYGERPIIGYGLLALQAAAGYLAYDYASQHKDKVAEYDEAKLLYLESTTEPQIESAWNEMNNIYDDVLDLQKKRDIFIITAGVVYLYNLLDVGLIAKFPEISDNVKIRSRFDENGVKVAVNVDF